MAHAHRTYLPAAGHDWMLPLYDPLVKVLGGDAARRALLAQAHLEAATRVLDVGCGTGSLAVLVAREHPALDVVALDPDPKALARARRKVHRAGVSVQIDQAFADALPYPDDAFDRVLSSFVLHHLEGNDKVAMLREARRVLRPGGSLHLMDFARPDDGDANRLARWVHSNRHLRDNTEMRVRDFMDQAGFSDVRIVGRGGLLMGRVTYYRCTR